MEESSSTKDFKEETSDSELSDFLDEMHMFGFEDATGGVAGGRDRLFSWSSSDNFVSSEDEDPFTQLFQTETLHLIGDKIPVFEVKVESPKKKTKRKRVVEASVKKKKKKRRRKSCSEDNGEPNARREIALKRQRKKGRFVESEWEFVPISQVL